MTEDEKNKVDEIRSWKNDTTKIGPEITKVLTALELQSEALAKIEKMDLSEKAPDLIWLHNWRNNTKCAARDAQSAVEKLLSGEGE